MDFSKIFDFFTQAKTEAIESRKSLWGMSTLARDRSGLPVKIWLDDSMDYRRHRHGKRLKFQTEHGGDPSTRSYAVMTIEDSPKVIGKHKLSEREVNEIRDFVIRNRQALEDLSDEKIDIFKFKDLMR